MMMKKKKITCHVCCIAQCNDKSHLVHLEMKNLNIQACVSFPPPPYQVGTFL